MLRRASLAGIVTLLVTATPVSAAATVQVVDFGFSPKATTVGQGETVTWDNTGEFDHSSTGNAPLRLWTFDIPSGDDHGRAFRQAGTFPFHCRFHSSMTGRVRVPLETSDLQVAKNELVTITVATVAAPAGFRYVLQRRAPGAGSFSAWKTITTRSTTFKSATAGEWRFRSRLLKIANGAHSDWSPVLAVEVSA